MVTSAPDVPGIGLTNVNFAYSGCPPFIRNCNLEIPRGSRCLLVGANGAGKTSMLQLVAGKYMVGKEDVLVLGRSPFHDMQLTCSGALSYLGTSWRKDVACAGYGVPLQGDISAGKMIFGVEGVDPVRRSTLVRLLDIDLYQRLTTMSDGQRRRVQICVGLLKPYEVLLMDEITVDLDVVGRLDLLAFFKQECEERGATILYATHIFDGLEDWVTHVSYMENGEFVQSGPYQEIVSSAESSAVFTDGKPKKLLHLVEHWLRTDRDRALADKEKRGLTQGPGVDLEPIKPKRTPMMPSKHLAYFY